MKAEVREKHVGVELSRSVIEIGWTNENVLSINNCVSVLAMIRSYVKRRSRINGSRGI